MKMWYDEPSDDWMKSLPIGNGRLSGMVFGGVEKEKVAFNEITLWSDNRMRGRRSLLKRGFEKYTATVPGR